MSFMFRYVLPEPLINAAIAVAKAASSGKQSRDYNDALKAYAAAAAALDTQGGRRRAALEESKAAATTAAAAPAAAAAGTTAAAAAAAATDTAATTTAAEATAKVAKDAAAKAGVAEGIDLQRHVLFVQVCVRLSFRTLSKSCMHGVAIMAVALTLSSVCMCCAHLTLEPVEESCDAPQM
jgi:hypothetical protein